MHTFAQKPKATQQTTSAKSTIPGRGQLGQSPEVKSILHLQRTIGNQAVQRALQADTDQPEAELNEPASTRFGHNFSRIAVHPPAVGAIQTKLAINKLGDSYEQEADRMTVQVMRMPEPQFQRACTGAGAHPKYQTEQPIQEHEFSQPKRVQANDTGHTIVPPIVHEVLSSPGQPLDAVTRSFMEPRFGHDFSQVRVHADTRAAESARVVKATAYTVGQHVVFGGSQPSPQTNSGRQLLAHELTHVVQQRAAGRQRIQRQPDDPARFKRVPPGPGAYTEAEYKDWERRHPKSILERAWETKPTHGEYTPGWFWARGYFYAGSMYGGYQGARFEIWLSNEGPGHEYRLWRGPKTEGVKEPPVGPDYIDPNADRKHLFGPIIAARENMDAAFGKGDVVLYEDGTFELFLEGTTQSYVFLPVPGGLYVVYGPDGRRLNMKWVIPEADIPDPDTDAVE